MAAVSFELATAVALVHVNNTRVRFAFLSAALLFHTVIRQMIGAAFEVTDADFPCIHSLQIRTGTGDMLSTSSPYR